MIVNSTEPIDGQAPGTARTMGSQTQGGAGQGLKDEAMAQVHAFVDQASTTAQETVRSTATTGKNSAAEALNGIALSLSIAGRQLRDQQNGAGRFVEQAADRLDKAAKYIDTADVDELVQRTERWARSSPALFLGGAFVIGVLGARFLKSSRPALAYQGSGARRATFDDRDGQVSPVRGDA